MALPGAALTRWRVRQCVHFKAYADREEALRDLTAIADLADFVENNEPELISYNVYFSDDGSQMTVMHVHRDAASLDYHMDVAGPRFARFASLLTLKSIHVYGHPSPKAVSQLQEKVQLLGSGDLIVQAPHAGFSSFEPAK